MTVPTLIDLNMVEHNKGLWHYPYMASLYICNRSCNTLDVSSG